MKIIAVIFEDEQTAKCAAEGLGWKWGTAHPDPEGGYWEVDVPDDKIKTPYYEGNDDGTPNDQDSRYAAMFTMNVNGNNVEIEIGDGENDSWCPSETTWIGEGRH